MAATLARLRAAGLTVAASGNSLLASPAGRLTPELRAVIRAHKAEILADLAGEASGLAPFETALRLGRLVVCERCQHYASPPGDALVGRCGVLGEDVAGAVPFTCGRYHAKPEHLDAWAPGVSGNGT